MSVSKNNHTRVDFLKNYQTTILKKSLNFVDIIKLAKDNNVKGLTNPKIRAFFHENGIEYAPSSNKHMKLSVGQDTSDSHTSESKFLKNSKHLSELTAHISKQEQLSEELLRKFTELATIITLNNEESLRKYASYIPFNIEQFMGFSFSNSKRYEVTLREDLVNKAIDKIKIRCNIDNLDPTKLSKLFEIILFDYIYSSL